MISENLCYSGSYGAGGILPFEFLPVGILSVEYLPTGILPIWNYTHMNFAYRNFARRKLERRKSARGNLPAEICL